MTLLKLLDRPIAFHRPFVTLTGSVTAALMLSQALYWSQRTDNADGWFWKTQEQWKEETGLSRQEQETAREKLRYLGILDEKSEGLPKRLYFRVNLQKLEEMLLGTAADKNAEKSHTREGVFRTQEGEFSADKRGENSHTTKRTEITSETTTETTPPYPPNDLQPRQSSKLERIQKLRSTESGQLLCWHFPESVTQNQGLELSELLAGLYSADHIKAAVEQVLPKKPSLQYPLRYLQSVLEGTVGQHQVQPKQENEAEYYLRLLEEELNAGQRQTA